MPRLSWVVPCLEVMGVQGKGLLCREVGAKCCPGRLQGSSYADRSACHRPKDLRLGTPAAATSRLGFMHLPTALGLEGI